MILEEFIIDKMKSTMIKWRCLNGGRITMIIYNKFDTLLQDKGIGKTELQKKLEISPSTMANFAKNKYVAMSIIDIPFSYCRSDRLDIRFITFPGLSAFSVV